MVYREHTCYLIKYSYLAEENKKGLNSTYTKRHTAGNRIKTQIKSSDPKFSIHFSQD